MGAPKKATHIVVHRKLYLAGKGKPVHYPVDTEMVLSKEIGDRLIEKGMVKEIGEKKAVDLTAEEPTKKPAE